MTGSSRSKCSRNRASPAPPEMSVRRQDAAIHFSEDCRGRLYGGRVTASALFVRAITERNGAPIKFVNQLRIQPVTPDQPFADEGDSGSLVVRASDHAAVGLLFAKDSDNSGTYAVANRFEFVRERLHIELLGGLAL